MTRPRGSRLPAAQRTRDEVAALGVTPRQLGYWIERRWVRPDAPVQGRPRSFSEPEKRVLAAMARLVRAGLPAELAAAVARRAVRAADADPGADAEVDLGGGIYVTVTGIWSAARPMG